MPTITAAGYAYAPFPTQEPAVAPASRQQTLTARPESFGTPALQTLGRAFEQTGDVLAKAAQQRQQWENQVNVTQQENFAEAAMTRLLYGDPAVPGDVGFRGKRGMDAVRAWPEVYREMERFAGEGRAQLQNPAQQQLFDATMNRVKRQYFAEGGRHYDAQRQAALEGEVNANVQLARNAGSRAANEQDWTGFKTQLDASNGKIAQGLSTLGKGEAEIRSKVEENTSQFARTWALALGDRDPVGAQSFIDQHKTMFNDNDFAEMSGRFRTRAKELKAYEFNFGTGPVRRGESGKLVRGDAVEQALDEIKTKESSDRNIHQQLVDPSVSTAQGYYQITNSTWRDFAPRVGIDLSAYPTAMRAPPDIQRQVAREILTASDGGPQRWKALGAQRQQEIASEIRATPVSTAPAPSDGFAPDTSVPGLPEHLAQLNKRLDDAGATPEERVDAYKLARATYNDAWTQRERQLKIQREQQTAVDEQVTNQFITRMGSASANYPTLDEVKGNQQLSARAKENLLGVLRADTRGEPDRAISARNYPGILSRILASPGAEGRIDNEDAIFAERTQQNITNSDMESLRKIFKERNDPRTAELVEARKRFLDSVAPQVAPSTTMLPSGIMRIMEPKEGENSYRLYYKLNALEAKLAKEGRNPIELYDPASPDFPGRPEALKEFLPTPTAASILRPTGATADLTTLKGIQAEVAAGRMTREQGVAEARKRGLIREPLAPPVR